MDYKDLKKYPFTTRPLLPEEGGGILIKFLDFDGCMSDGENMDEAIKNGYEALKDCIDAMKEWNMPIPKPFDYLKKEKNHSGKIALRLSKSLHSELAERAKKENVSMNFLAALLIAEGLGMKRQRL